MNNKGKEIKLSNTITTKGNILIAGSNKDQLVDKMLKSLKDVKLTYISLKPPYNSKFEDNKASFDLETLTDYLEELKIKLLERLNSKDFHEDYKNHKLTSNVIVIDNLDFGLTLHANEYKFLTDFFDILDAILTISIEADTLIIIAINNVIKNTSIRYSTTRQINNHIHVGNIASELDSNAFFEQNVQNVRLSDGLAFYKNMTGINNSVQIFKF